MEEAVPIGLVLDRVDIYVHYGSTSSMEAYIHKVTSIIRPVNSDYDIYVYDKIIDIDSRGEFFEYIDSRPSFSRNIKTEQIIEDYVDYYYNSDYHPLETTIAFIESDLKRKELNIEKEKRNGFFSSYQVWIYRLSIYKIIRSKLLRMKIKEVFKYIGYLSKLKTKGNSFFTDIKYYLKSKFPKD